MIKAENDLLLPFPPCWQAWSFLLGNLNYSCRSAFHCHWILYVKFRFLIQVDFTGGSVGA